MIYIGKTSLQKIFEKLLGYFAPIESPKLTGIPTAPTPADTAADDSTQIANVAYVKANRGSGDSLLELDTEGNLTTKGDAMKNIVPRANVEGSLGTEQKRWGSLYTGKVSISTNGGGGNAMLGGSGRKFGLQLIPDDQYKGSTVEIIASALWGAVAFQGTDKDGNSGKITFDVAGSGVNATTFNGTATKAQQDANGKQIDTTYATMDWVKQYFSEQTKPHITITGTLEQTQASDSNILFRVLESTITGTIEGITIQPTNNNTLEMYKYSDTLGYLSGIYASEGTGTALTMKIDVGDVITVSGKFGVVPPQRPCFVLDNGEIAKVTSDAFTDPAYAGKTITITFTKA